MYCTECGASLRSGDKFCRKCGKVSKARSTVKKVEAGEPTPQIPTSPGHGPDDAVTDYKCQTCGTKLRYLKKYGRYWCDKCQSYAPTTEGTQYSPGTVKTFYVLALITSIVGGIMLATLEFAGWYNYDYYNKIRSWGSVGPWSNSGAFIVFMAVSATLFLCSYIAIRGLASKTQLSRTYIWTAISASLIVFIIVIIGAAVFFITNDAGNNWLSAGFYGGALGGFLTLLFFGQILRSTPPSPPKQQHYQTTYRRA
jgi:predicted RNA-binding Zn-ribbon protein involved in translation (DUF1610 family)